MDAKLPMVVGLGRGRHGFPELDWAAHEAHRRGTTLRVVRAYHLADAPQSWVMTMDRGLIEDLRGDAERHLITALDHVRPRWPDLPVQCAAVDGVPDRVLAAESRRAALTVVGRRPRGRLASTVFASIDRALAARAPCPVVAVGPVSAERPEAPVVGVGVGTASGSDDVLAFAFDFAAQHGWHLHALVYGPTKPTAELFGRLDRLARWRAEYPGVATRAEVVDQDPADGLVAASAGHALLVIGGRTRHPRLAMLAGSVGQRLLARARCPVAVIPASASNGGKRAGRPARQRG